MNSTYLPPRLLGSCIGRLHILALWLLLGMAAQAAYPFFDNFESGLGNWTASGSWGLSTEPYISANHAAADSPSVYYTNNTDSALTLVASIDLSGAALPALSFQHAYFLENGYDYAEVEASTNGGSSWIAPALAEFTGTLTGMSREQIDLSPFKGAANFRLRFHLVTDPSVVMDGWYVDDVRIAEAPAAVTLSAVHTNRTSVDLLWTRSTAGNFAGYRLYRALAPGVDWHYAQVVAELGSSNSTNVTDITVCPKTKYYYRVAVINTDGLLTLGNEIPVTTPAGADYPFLDNGEGGSATWVADAPWALSTEAACSAVHAWASSPGTNYANSIASQSLTLVAPLFLAGKATAPVLSFTHQYDFSAGDSGNVEISTNQGADWTTLTSFTGTITNQWRRGRLELAAYTNSTALLRFRITTGTGPTARGWHVDDISVAESPTAVPAPILDNVTSHSVRVTWTANTNSSFAYYAVFRATNAGAGINSTLAATVTNQATTSFTDNNLALDTAYYYRVYAVTPYGTFSADSAFESTIRTLNNPVPFAENFENGLLNWNLTGSWGLTTNQAHGGLYTLTDSPSGNYTNFTDGAARTAVNLAGTSWPVIRFWDRFDLAPNNNDFGVLEVSPDGNGWIAVYGVAGSRTEWAEQTIDLSRWKNQANLRLRFHLTTDDFPTRDGWYIDDLSVTDLGAPTLALPFVENFEKPLTNWQHAGWLLDTNNPLAGIYSAHDTPAGWLTPGTEIPLELNGALVLTNLLNPQLTYWIRGSLAYQSYFRAQVSTDGGLSWSELSAVNQNYYFNSGWLRQQVSLQPYTNQTVRLRFFTSSSYYTAPDEDMFLDNLTLQEMPAPVALLDVTPHLKTVDLTWSPTTLGSAFKRYEIYRATHPNVTFNDQLIASFSSAGTTNLTDSGLSIGATYYYTVMTVNTNDTYSPSNERMTTTVPLNLPLTDTLENLGQWVVTGSWGIATNGVHSGSGSLSDSPFGDYVNNSDTYALTAVNLTGTSWPVLRFWDRFDLAPNNNDFGFLEVSTDGNSWISLYGVAGSRTDWAEQTIDLSRWKNQPNLRIRFHLTTDTSLVQDGWHIDDLSVSDLGSPIISLPFFESFEKALTNWLHAGWSLDTNNPLAGFSSAHDSLAGWLTPGTELPLQPNGSLVLTNLLNPQLTYWIRGNLAYQSYFRAQVSTDGGLSWSELSAVNQNYYFNSGWIRQQVSLQPYTNQTVRLRFFTSSSYYTAPDEDVFLDNLTLQEMPAPVALLNVTPHLKTVDLTWSPTTLGSSFKRYEVYRATHPNVTFNDQLIGSFTGAGTTNLTDSGLSIGATYYYTVMTVNTNDTYSPSNERMTTTVPLNLPLTDTLENLGQWVVTGTWGIATNGVHSGLGSLSDSPFGDYVNNSDTYALTAVNLTGTSWPVLRFWDRFDLAPNNNDFGFLEVSTDGNSWISLYGVAGSRADWAEQTIDLSRWKNQPNLRIRFHLTTDGSLAQDGWHIDDFAITDLGSPVISLPFSENFEKGLTNWLHAGWTLDTNAPLAGLYSLHDTPAGWLSPGTEIPLALNASIVLTNLLNPQLTYWVRGNLAYQSYFRAQISADSGLSWSELSAVNQNYYFNSGWLRQQVSLQPYTNQTVRLRFFTSSSYYTAPDEDMFLDNVTLQEMPAPVALTGVTPHLKTVDLTWTPTTLGNSFKRYEIYRATHPNVTFNDQLVGTFATPTVTNLTDSGLSIGSTYYYTVMTVNTNDTYSPSNERMTTTVPLNLPFVDAMETLDQWVVSGAWGIAANASHSGLGCLSDSPSGDYVSSSHSYALTALNLTGTSWPVLRFWDRYDLAPNSSDFGSIEVSTDGNTWFPLYGVSGSRTNWAEQTVDLSRWKNQANLRLRFHFATDDSLTQDGWYIDDFTITDLGAAMISVPFFDNFEKGLTNWQHAGWALDTNNPVAGLYAIHDTPNGWLIPGLELSLELNGSLLLTNLVNPQLTYWIRGNLGYQIYFRAQVSTDNGLSWNELSAVNQNYYFNSDWIRQQVSLQPYTNQVLRLRFITTSSVYAALEEDIFLDNIGIGDPVPGTPTLNAPAQLTSVNVVRPTLIVNNAIDYQSYPLTYRFEVYSDAATSNLVAQVPVVASGTSTTAWQVDQVLANNSQYWWRCQASDGTNTGPWMSLASFYVNATNHAPYQVVVAMPDNLITLANTNELLTWYPTSDPDTGDFIAAYHLQVDTNQNFAAPRIDDSTIVIADPPEGPYGTISLTLGRLAGSTNLLSGTTYYWRIRAEDNHASWSAWSAGPDYFLFGSAAPQPARLTSIRPLAGGGIQLQWGQIQNSVFVEFSPTLKPAAWTNVAGPLTGTNWSQGAMPTNRVGYYRLRSQ